MKHEILIETDTNDFVFIESHQRFVDRHCIVGEGKLISMVDELGLWSNIGGSLNVE